MAVITTDIYSAYIASSKESCGNTIIYDSRVAKSGFKSISKTPSHARTKPASLLTNPTTCGPHYEIESRDGFAEKFSFGGWVVCYPGGPYESTETSEIRMFSAAAASTPVVVTTNWQLGFRLKMKKKTYSLSSSIAEFDETCRMFSLSAKGIFRAYKKLKRYARKRKFKKINRSPEYQKLSSSRKRNFSLDDVSGTILLANFGLAPLVGDLSEAYIALQRRLLRDVLVRIVHKETSVGSLSTDSGSYRYQNERTVVNRAIAWVRLDVSQPLQYGNMVEWFWERIPFSFIVDQMINVGDTLSALDAFKGVTGLYGTLSTWTIHNGVGTYHGTNFTTTTPSSYKMKMYDRSVLSVGNIPLPEFPSYSPSSSLKAVVNDLAVLHQLRKGNRLRFR